MHTEPTAHPVDRHAPAVWAVRHRWFTAIGLALIPVIFTAVGSALAQLGGWSEASSMLAIAGAAIVSAVVGLVVMRRARPSLRAFGFRVPRGGARALWYLPPAATVLVVLATQGIVVSPTVGLAAAALAVTVAINEELWFRGLVLAVLRQGGAVPAVLGSSLLFGVLHLANLASGVDPRLAALQVLFAVLFGLAAALLLVVTGSLWPAIVWHAAWDLANYLGGNAATPMALLGLGAASLIIVGYCVALWRLMRGAGRVGADEFRSDARR